MLGPAASRSAYREPLLGVTLIQPVVGHAAPCSTSSGSGWYRLSLVDQIHRGHNGFCGLDGVIDVCKTNTQAGGMSWPAQQRIATLVPCAPKLRQVHPDDSVAGTGEA